MLPADPNAHSKEFPINAHLGFAIIVADINALDKSADKFCDGLNAFTCQPFLNNKYQYCYNMQFYFYETIDKVLILISIDIVIPSLSRSITPNLAYIVSNNFSFNTTADSLSSLPNSP